MPRSSGVYALVSRCVAPFGRIRLAVRGVASADTRGGRSGGRTCKIIEKMTKSKKKLSLSCICQKIVLSLRQILTICHNEGRNQTINHIGSMCSRCRYHCTGCCPLVELLQRYTYHNQRKPILSTRGHLSHDTDENNRNLRCYKKIICQLNVDKLVHNSKNLLLWLNNQVFINYAAK